MTRRKETTPRRSWGRVGATRDRESHPGLLGVSLSQHQLRIHQCDLKNKFCAKTSIKVCLNRLNPQLFFSAGLSAAGGCQLAGGVGVDGETAALGGDATCFPRGTLLIFQMGKLRPWRGKGFVLQNIAEIFLLFQALSPQYVQPPRKVASGNTCPVVSHTADLRWHQEVRYFPEGGLALQAWP